MTDEYALFDDDVDTSEMPINVQKKGWEDILRRQSIEKVTATPDEIAICSDDGNLKTTIILKLLKKKVLSAALQMLHHLQYFPSFFADSEM